MRRYTGFTLIELLVVMCCALVILTWSFGGFSELIARYRIHLAKNQLVQIIQYSRHMGLVSGHDLALNGLDNDWSRGIVLFSDNLRHRYTEQDQLLQIWQWSQPGIQVVWRGFQSQHFIVLSHDLSHAASNGQFQFLKQDRVLGKLTLNRVGRVVVE